MKRLMLFLFLVICAFVAKSQESVPEDRIYISVLQPDRDNIPSEARNQLELKLNQLLTQNGFANEDPNNRFVLTSKVAILTKDIVPGPPQRVSMNVDFTFIVGDAAENKKFESVTLSTIGVGINENKAFIAAIKSIKTKNPELTAFLKRAKKEIQDYYVYRCESIKKDAAAEAEKRNYEKAIYLLMQIPDICECAQDCQDLAIQYNQDCLNNQASQLLNEAKALWAASPTPDGASAAADVIARIPANTSVQSGIDALTREINSKLRADQRARWEFKMKQYNDQVEKQKRDDQARLEQQRADNTYRANQQRADNSYRAKQQEANNEYRRTQQAADNAYRSNQQAADNAARRQAIEAARQVGIEYAKNQPKTVTYNQNVILW